MKVGNVKKVYAASEGKAVNETMQALEKKSMKNTNEFEATPESMSTKESMSLNSAQAPKQSQEKLLVVSKVVLSTFVL